MYKVRPRPAFATVSVKTQAFASHIICILFNNKQISEHSMKLREAY